MKQFINDINDIYIMYLRKSRKDTEHEILNDEEILRRHEARLYELAERLDINKEQIIIKREVVSGETIAERPVMIEILELIEDDNIRRGYDSRGRETSTSVILKIKVLLPRHLSLQIL